MSNQLEQRVTLSDKPYSFVVENNWLTRGKYWNFGWGNGYVAIPKDHPWYLGFNDIGDVSIHGGLTFAELINGMWVIGFDTAHGSDTLARWPKESVVVESNKLLGLVNSAKKSINKESIEYAISVLKDCLAKFAPLQNLSARTCLLNKIKELESLLK